MPSPHAPLARPAAQPIPIPVFSPRLPGFDPTDGADTMAPMVAILTLIRNRDCLTCYLRHRMERLENMRWDVGDMPEDQRANLSEHERTFADEYNKLLSTYQIAYDVDITRDLEPPDDNLLVRVNVLRDVGQIVGPESGSNLELKKGDECFLRRGDVEHLIRRGDVQHILQ
eukprot:Transcript_3634.p1 GENE.Transcript_3634~~Transcript_3634.p1  ORF type:complete len:171 (+),score=45.59 Transcript_3634:310-822(+)